MLWSDPSGRWDSPIRPDLAFKLGPWEGANTSKQGGKFRTKRVLCREGLG